MGANMAMDAKDIAALRSDALAPAEIEAKAEILGLNKSQAKPGKAFVLAIMAGLLIGLGGMFMLLFKSEISFPFVASQALGAIGFSMGLFLVVCTGAELFTGNCLMICGKLSEQYSWASMLKSWVIVYAGNLLGSLLLVALLVGANYAAFNSEAVGNAMITVAAGKVSQPFGVLLFKGILCNFLVCLAVWVSFAARTITDKFFAVLMPITAFVACGFEHCVANMFLLPMGLATKLLGFAYSGSANIEALNIGSVATNLAAVTIG
ncbi:MAG: formate/nitrite transporter family protein, partial [Coriobacteriales bacterium]|nr:formate/nitrite transporter family protein [Coriobacteriales bacterium]